MSIGIGGSPDWDPMAAINNFQDQKISKTQSDVAGLGSGSTQGKTTKPFSADSFTPAELEPDNSAPAAETPPASAPPTGQTKENPLAAILDKIA